jgi:predicted nucleotidyltransferase
MIPDIHRKFIDHAVGVLKQDRRIAGIALCGSYKTGMMDEYSDLDFIVAVDPAFFEQVLGDKMAIAASLGELLSAFTGEHIGVPNLLICLYDAPLLHVDLHFITPEEERKRVEDPVILYERDGALTTIYRNTEITEVRLDPQWLEDRFWVWVHYIALKIARGELFEAIDAVTFIRARVIGPLLHVKKGRLPRGVRRLERDAPEYVAALSRTVPAYETGSCIEALKTEIGLYRELRQPYQSSLILRDKAELRATEYLDQIGTVKNGG